VIGKPATEVPKRGAVEIWRIFNLTGDTHPIHFHLVNVQVLSRRPFHVVLSNRDVVGTLVGLGKDSKRGDRRALSNRHVNDDVIHRPILLPDRIRKDREKRFRLCPGLWLQLGASQ
jgi:FtsP/CotA-like multicopper oxidase with cupredoxin domain